jgi:hypothetical protein
VVPSSCGRFGDSLLFFIAAKSWWLSDPLAVIQSGTLELSTTPLLWVLDNINISKEKTQHLKKWNFFPGFRICTYSFDTDPDTAF